MAQLLRNAKWAVLPVLTAIGMMLGGLANAHHGYSLNYETDNIGTIEGVVEEVFWSNPHVQYYIAVKREDGSTQTWIVETHNLRILQNAGWTRDTVKVGDTIKVTGYLGRQGRPRIAGMKFELADGSVHSLFGEERTSSQ